MPIVRLTGALWRCQPRSYHIRHLFTTTAILQDTSPRDPLKPSIPVSNLGLPLAPQAIDTITTSKLSLSSVDLERLHRLSALNPPPKDSAEEKELLEGLNELIDLMDAVKAVQLPEGRDAMQRLLNRGVGEIVIGEGTGQEGEKERVEGRELLEWATRRKGDYYHSKAGKRVDGT